MFTGIISHTGIFSRSKTRVSIESNMDLGDVKSGDSIALNGVCLTTLESHQLLFDIGPETLKCTTLGNLKNGQEVHLEKALRLSDRLGGHLVQGHVDGIGTITSLFCHPALELEIQIKASPKILKLCIPKGSIAIDGVSLTINHLDKESFSVCLVPHTLEKTLFSKLQIGDQVNLETDLIGKYVTGSLSDKLKI